MFYSIYNFKHIYGSTPNYIVCFKVQCCPHLNWGPGHEHQQGRRWCPATVAAKMMGDDGCEREAWHGTPSLYTMTSPIHMVIVCYSMLILITGISQKYKTGFSSWQLGKCWSQHKTYVFYGWGRWWYIYIYYIPYIKLVKMFANSNQPGCQINFVLLGSPEIGPA